MLIRVHGLNLPPRHLNHKERNRKDDQQSDAGIHHNMTEDALVPLFQLIVFSRMQLVHSQSDANYLSWVRRG